MFIYFPAYKTFHNKNFFVKITLWSSTPHLVIYPKDHSISIERIYEQGFFFLFIDKTDHQEKQQ